MTVSVVELKDVTVTFKRGWLQKKVSVQAVSDVSLAIFEKEILVLVGESGCGKTTLGRVALRLVKPTSGKVLYLGENMWEMERRELKKFRSMAQIVHQDSYASLNPVRTIYQTLKAPLLQYGVKSRDVKEKVEELLRLMGVIPPEYFFNKYPYHLSGGMRQRVVFARSTIPKPKFIMADEPVSMIDASLKLSILDLMMKLNEELGITFLYITHDLATARYIGRRGRIAVMYLGKIVEMGALEEIFQRPLHPYLHALLSSASVPDPRMARKKKLLPLKSLELPGAEGFPSACRFHPRCPYAKEICSREVPELKEYGDGHRVACHLVERIPPWSLM